MKNFLWAIALLAIASCNPKVPVSKITVGSATADCTGSAPQKCLFVKLDNQTDWVLFYDNIEGFNYEPGYEYVLEVKTENIANPPADASSIKWTLVKEVSKTKKDSEGLPQIKPVVKEDVNLTITVASKQGNCTGVAPQKCLYIKEEGKDWMFFYDNIEGFTYEPGYEYVLEVKSENIDNPPADASSIKWTLVQQVSKTKKQSEGLPKK